VKSIILILLMIILSFSVFASIGENQFYSDTTGTFNALNNDITITGTKTLSNADFIPIIEDLDGDGVNEIIAVDGSTIRIYQGLYLTIIDAFSSGNLSGEVFIDVYDIDGDGYKEILSISEEMKLYKSSFSLFPLLSFMKSPLIIQYFWFNRLLGIASSPLKLHPQPNTDLLYRRNLCQCTFRAKVRAVACIKCVQVKSLNIFQGAGKLFFGWV